jgi:hypothetical protein
MRAVVQFWINYTDWISFRLEICVVVVEFTDEQVNATVGCWYSCMIE